MLIYCYNKCLLPRSSWSIITLWYYQSEEFLKYRKMVIRIKR